MSVTTLFISTELQVNYSFTWETLEIPFKNLKHAFVIMIKKHKQLEILKTVVARMLVLSGNRDCWIV